MPSGNRGVSSRAVRPCLEHLGINLHLTPAQRAGAGKDNMCFMFAQIYHSSMKYAAPVRKRWEYEPFLMFRPPLQSSRATMQLMGVYDHKLVEPLAQVLSNLGVVRGVVVSGSDGMDK